MRLGFLGFPIQGNIEVEWTLDMGERATEIGLRHHRMIQIFCVKHVTFLDFFFFNWDFEISLLLGILHQDTVAVVKRKLENFYF